MSFDYSKIRKFQFGFIRFYTCSYSCVHEHVDIQKHVGIHAVFFNFRFRTFTFQSFAHQDISANTARSAVTVMIVYRVKDRLGLVGIQAVYQGGKVDHAMNVSFVYDSLKLNKKFALN